MILLLNLGMNDDSIQEYLDTIPFENLLEFFKYLTYFFYTEEG